MGEPITPLVKGNDCPQCTPSIWLPGETPRFILATFSGITICPNVIPPLPKIPNGAFIMQQFQPCQWRFQNLDFQIELTYAGGQSKLTAHAFGPPWFHQVTNNPCQSNFSNTLVCDGPILFGSGGTGFVDLFDIPATEQHLMVDFNFNDDLDTLFEAYHIPDENAWINVRNFANLKTPMNVAIKLDFTHWDQYHMLEA